MNLGAVFFCWQFDMQFSYATHLAHCQGSVVCHVFPPHVSIFGLFPALVRCHYELSLFQLCLSN